MTTRRILVTGGAGCLGTNLVGRFLEQGHEICVIDNYATGRRDFHPSHAALRVHDGSIADARLITEIFASFRPTHVIHSAAAYKSPDDWAEDVATNVLGTVHVAQAARTAKVERLIYFQTALCYGRPRQTPIPIDHPLGPFTSYGISKTAGEEYALNSGIPVVSLRLANICAPHLAIGPIPTFYRRLKAGQKCFCTDAVRDFLDVSDFHALLELALQPGAPTGAFNVSTGEGHSILEVYREVARALRLAAADVPVVPPGADDVAAVVLDPAVTEQTFGWRAKVDFAETIRRQIAWYESHGVAKIFSHLAAPKLDDAKPAAR
jgi:UDP-glucose 4-epimerase